MKIIKIAENVNGSHDNRDSINIKVVPNGWAFVPPTLDTPNFPFGEITATEINGIVTVTSWTAGTMPEPEPAIPQMTTEEIILDKLTELEYRQDLMELGLTEGGTEI